MVRPSQRGVLGQGGSVCGASAGLVPAQAIDDDHSAATSSVELRQQDVQMAGLGTPHPPDLQTKHLTGSFIPQSVSQEAEADSVLNKPMHMRTDECHPQLE
ncbi:hypothetical protein EK904_007668 [Melospiza melodia maxima]|nr:hypothetical protein EK904_007668 [Melospiza melodia maxima]